MKPKKPKKHCVRCVKCKNRILEEDGIIVQEVIDTFGNLPGFMNKVRWYLNLPMISWDTKVYVYLCEECMLILVAGRRNRNAQNCHYHRSR